MWGLFELYHVTSSSTLSNSWIFSATVLKNLSTFPFVCGWCTLPRTCLISCFTRAFSNSVAPLSLASDSTRRTVCPCPRGYSRPAPLVHRTLQHLDSVLRGRFAEQGVFDYLPRCVVLVRYQPVY